MLALCWLRGHPLINPEFSWFYKTNFGREYLIPCGRKRSFDAVAVCRALACDILVTKRPLLLSQSLQLAFRFSGSAAVSCFLFRLAFPAALLTSLLSNSLYSRGEALISTRTPFKATSSSPQSAISHYAFPPGKFIDCSTTCLKLCDRLNLRLSLLS